MSTTVVDDIGLLVTNDPAHEAGTLGVRRDAAVLIDAGAVVAVGDAGTFDADERIDAGGRCVIPGFVDSHTHLVFDGDRGDEFVARMAGQPYAAGGILTTVAATRAASDAVLAGNLDRRLAEARRHGTTTVEIKSGYGLTRDDEVRCITLAAEHTTHVTSLAAHVVPAEFAGDTDGYVRHVCGVITPSSAAAGATCIDAFCEVGAFDVDQCRELLDVGRRLGLAGRLHAAQLGPSHGVRLAVELGCDSVDHCTHLTDADIAALASGTTVATLLPASDFCTRQPYPPARALLDAGVIVALASNCNPGSSYTVSLPFCVALAVREMAMTIDEALAAATLGGAAALRRDDIGHLRPGARADLVVLDAPSYTHLAYRPGVHLVAATMIAGVIAPVPAPSALATPGTRG